MTAEIQGTEEKSLEKELSELLNRHSAENRSNTPDFILAGFLTGCLVSWHQSTRRRDDWWGVNHKISDIV